MEIGFYHLVTTSLENALVPLLKKTLAQKKNAVVVTDSEEHTEHLANFLWVYQERSFLPHGTPKDGFAEMQPIWLTSQIENPNQAAFLFLLHGVKTLEAQGFERVFYLFDGRNQEGLQEARNFWQQLTGVNCQRSYWAQSEQGKWEQKSL